MTLIPDLTAYIKARIAEFDDISPLRQRELRELARHVGEQRDRKQEAHLIFICTHNSRRSHLAQVWAQVGAAYYGIDHLHAYSGGTEATAFNPRAVWALMEAGFEIEKAHNEHNPLYTLTFSSAREPLQCFSKRFDDPVNPQKGFGAVMTCSDADEACPLVPGASARFAIRYVDPKLADNTPAEAETYLERCRQIAREMLFALSSVPRN
ncbi:MAG: protein-tyrosine-phosphatase [Calditrichaeota bacterium]|nr:protein-tyrosine-phosphatase [Calditrichota bacterium]